MRWQMARDVIHKQCEHDRAQIATLHDPINYVFNNAGSHWLCFVGKIVMEPVCGYAIPL